MYSYFLSFSPVRYATNLEIDPYRRHGLLTPSLLFFSNTFPVVHVCVAIVIVLLLLLFLFFFTHKAELLREK